MLPGPAVNQESPGGDVVKGLLWGQCRPLSTHSSYTVCVCVHVCACQHTHELPSSRTASETKCAPVCQRTADALGGGQLALGVNLRQLDLWKGILRPRDTGVGMGSPGMGPLCWGRPAGSRLLALGLQCSSFPPPASTVSRAPFHWWGSLWPSEPNSANQMFSIFHSLCFKNTHLELGREGE